MNLTGRNLSVRSLTNPSGHGVRRKVGFLFWLLRNAPALVQEVRRADVVHTPIPGDIGTIGMLLALVWRKPLFVRHCGNWFVQKTTAEHFWKWFMERFASRGNVMLATGGGAEPPSRRNPSIRWIFSTTLTERELKVCSTPLRDRLSPERVRLIIACRQDKEKGTGVVIESLPSILRDFPQATLDVVGDGGALAKFSEIAAGLGVTDRITFHGKVDHGGVIRLLQKADLFCYPTAASEGFPKVVLEALACGLPVVTTPVSVLPHLIANGCGLIIEEATPEAVAGAVRECLSDAERYRTMSANARETAQQYSLERWRDTIGDQLQEVCGAVPYAI